MKASIPLKITVAVLALAILAAFGLWLSGTILYWWFGFDADVNILTYYIVYAII